MSHPSLEVVTDHSASPPWWLTLRDLLIAMAVVVSM
ncbi:MAG: hypothetical protein JWP29_783, partial [Rhodoferax sp.]|nr:hypothetical protein [Rhodoferax sp.]